MIYCSDHIKSVEKQRITEKKVQSYFRVASDRADVSIQRGRGTPGEQRC